jgi:hypothetical protein
MANRGQRNFLQTFLGDPNLVSSGNRTGTVTPCGEDGTIMQFNNSAEGGFIGVSPASVVTAGVAGGAIVDATSVSILTAPGQILTGQTGGQPNVVLPVGTDGQVLALDSTATPWGLIWTNPSAASGVVAATPGTISQRNGSGALLAMGFTTYGADILPSAAGANNVGNVSFPFASVQATSGVFTTVTTPTLHTTSGSLAVNGFTTVVLSGGGVTGLTVSSTSVLAAVPLAATQVVIGGALNSAGSWMLSIVGGQLTLSAYNGSSYVARQSFAAS